LHQDYFICHDDPHLWQDLTKKVDLLLGDPSLQRPQLERGLQDQLSLSGKNPILLQKFLDKKNVKNLILTRSCLKVLMNQFSMTGQVK
jgi:hypothetical protein